MARVRRTGSGAAPYISLLVALLHALPATPASGPAPAHRYAGLARRAPLIDLRGGASKEWVCDGDVCELKEVKTKAPAAKRKASSKSSSSAGGRNKAKAAAKKPLAMSSEGGGLSRIFSKISKAIFGSPGTTKAGGLVGAVRSIFSKLFGGKQSAADDEDEDEDEEEEAKATTKTTVNKEKKLEGASSSSASSSASASAEDAAAAAKLAKRKAAKAAAKAKMGRGPGGKGPGALRTSANLRIQRELRDFQTNAPPNCAVSVRPENINVWVITLTGVEGTLFEGEKHKLRIEFSKE
jgi:hypothetical protein